MNTADTLRRLPSPLQRLLALLALLALIALLWVGLVAPVRFALKSQASWRQAARKQISLERGWLQSVPRVKELQGNTVQSTIWVRFYSPEGTDDLSSRLRRDVMALLSASGANLTHTEALPAQSSNPLQRVAVRVMFSSTIDQLKRLLASIKGHSPYLRVEQIHISTPQSQSQDANATLTVTLEIYGYVGELDPSLKAGA
jgi:hypothetical protein